MARRRSTLLSLIDNQRREQHFIDRTLDYLIGLQSSAHEGSKDYEQFERVIQFLFDVRNMLQDFINSTEVMLNEKIQSKRTKKRSGKDKSTKVDKNRARKTK